MDRHPRRSCLRFELPAPGNRGSLCMRRLEGGVCEGLRGCVEQGDEPRSLRPCLSSAEKRAVNLVLTLVSKIRGGAIGPARAKKSATSVEGGTHIGMYDRPNLVAEAMSKLSL